MSTTHFYVTNRLVWIASVALLLLVLSAVWCTWQALVAGEMQYTCVSPVPYEDLLDAYKHGNTRLDGNDADKIPCNDRRPRKS